MIINTQLVINKKTIILSIPLCLLLLTCRQQNSNKIKATTSSVSSNPSTILGNTSDSTENTKQYTHCTPSTNVSAPNEYRVVDGDTIQIFKDGKKVNMRILGVNTPETVKPDHPVECGGRDASDFTKEFLKDHCFKFEIDDPNRAEDRFGRLLVYITRDDGVSLNATLLNKGKALLESRYKFAKYNTYKEEATKAMLSSEGLYSTCCNVTNPKSFLIIDKINTDTVGKETITVKNISKEIVPLNYWFMHNWDTFHWYMANKTKKESFKLPNIALKPNETIILKNNVNFNYKFNKEGEMFFLYEVTEKPDSEHKYNFDDVLMYRECR